MSNLILLLLFILLVLTIMFSIQLESFLLIGLITLALLSLYIFLINKNFFYTTKKRKSNYNNFYLKKDFMTSSELDFYNKIKIFENNFKIVPQINLATIIKKISKNKYQNELFRNIDFAIFTKDYSKLLLLIELNDKSHNQKERKKRKRFSC